MSDLRAIAEAATPGPWSVEEWGPDVALDTVNSAGGGRITVDFELTGLFAPENAAHIAAWSPDRALAALDVIEALRTWATFSGPVLTRTERWENVLRALDRWDALR